ncbi:hypothetical protein CYMTET_27570, partial [Cymbomonas tetramitiformis]
TDIITVLKANEFKGMLIILSANDSQEDINMYLEAGVHGTMKKTMGPKEMKTCLTRCWCKMRRQESK